jgi:D-psicose/D-tagatose/L-ribulose 3-epimerase
MRIGCNLMLWTGCFTKKSIKFIDKVAKLGFDGVELPLFDPKVVDVKATRRAIDGNGLGATACSVIIEGSFLAAGPRDRQKALDHQYRALEVSKNIGVECVAGPIYSPVGYLAGRARNAAEWKRAVGCLKKLAARAEDLDINVAIEPLNRFETYFLNICEDAAKLAKEVSSPNLGILYDTFHANIEEKDPVAALKKIGRKRLLHMHTCENDRGIPGSGHVPWDATMRALKQMKYDRWITIESFVPAIKELARAAAIWRPLAKDGDDLARRGLRFLRKYVK